MDPVSLGHFGDARREKAGSLLHARLLENDGQGVRVRQLGGDRNGEMTLTRFLDNPRVNPEGMVQEAARRLSRRCEGRHVLAIHDTTVVRSEGGGGLYLHPVIAVDAKDKAILGLAHAEFQTRDEGKKATRRSRAFEEKESFRWLQGARAAANACAAAEKVTVIGDAESDIYELFAQRPAGIDLLVRIGQDRRLAEGGRLFGAMDELPLAGRTRIEIPAKPGRRAREARLEVRYGSLEVAEPANAKASPRPDRVRVWVVDVREIDPPLGEDALHWRLMTTYAVEDMDQAWEIVGFYRLRWLIEQVFRTLKKQGFDIEGILIEKEAPLRNLVMATLIAAITIQQLVQARDGAPGPGAVPRPMTDAFEPDEEALMEAICETLEGNTERQKNPNPKGTLAYAAWVCARLGGWTGYYGKGGPIVTLRGWVKFQSMKQGASIMRAALSV